MSSTSMSIIKEYQMNSTSPNCWHLNTYDAKTSVAVAQVINEYDAACVEEERKALEKINKILNSAKAV